MTRSMVCKPQGALLCKGGQKLEAKVPPERPPKPSPELPPSFPQSFPRSFPHSFPRSFPQIGFEVLSKIEKFRERYWEILGKALGEARFGVAWGRKVLRGPTGRVTLGYRAAKLLRKETIVKDCADR